MRNSNVCPKCEHNHILHVALVPDTGEYSHDIRPLHVAAEYEAGGWMNRDPKRHIRAVGRLGACVCRGCGHTEFHVYHPHKIPIDGELVREQVGPEPEAPFR